VSHVFRLGASSVGENIIGFFPVGLPKGVVVGGPWSRDEGYWHGGAGGWRGRAAWHGISTRCGAPDAHDDFGQPLFPCSKDHGGAVDVLLYLRAWCHAAGRGSLAGAGRC
jgi:hypothetical protein